MNADTAKTLHCRVAKIEHLACNVRRVFLKPNSADRSAFHAGQYIDILLPDGQRRSFSIANNPRYDEFIELHVRTIAGGRFSHDLLNNLVVGTALDICGPFGNLYLRENSKRPILFMAGGTGFSPIKAIIEYALGIGVIRPMHLFWGARAQDELYLDTLASTWAADYSNFTYTPVVSQLTSEAGGQDKKGNAIHAIVADYPDLSKYEIYASGPPGMISAGYAAFIAQRLLPECFYTDHLELPPVTVAERDAEHSLTLA